MAPRQDCEGRRVRTRSQERGGERVRLFLGPHMRNYTLVATDTMDDIYKDIRKMFEPHVGDAEIEFLGDWTPGNTSNWYRFVGQGLRSNIQLGVKKPDSGGTDKGKRGMEKTKRAVHTIMHNWCIHDDPGKILPSSLAPGQVVRDNDTCSSDFKWRTMDPYMWQTKFAESLKRLSHITQGRDGYEEAIHHLENVYKDRLEKERAWSGRVITKLSIPDITAVMRIYTNKEKAEKEDPEDYKLPQHNLVLRQAPRGEDEPKASSLEEEGGEAGVNKLVLQHDLVLRQAPRMEDKDTSEG